MKKHSIALLPLLVLLTGCGAKTEEAPWQTAYRETGKYLQEQDTLSAGSVGGEWAVIGLSRAGLLSDETAQSYEQTVEDYVKQAGSVRLHQAKSTENSRTILGLTALGIDPAADSRFVKNGASPLDGLCAFACEGGGFRHSGEVWLPSRASTHWPPATASGRARHACST